MNNYKLVFIFSILLLSWQSPAQMASHSEVLKKVLSEKIDSILKETGIPSISISLIRGDSIIWSEAFGYILLRKVSRRRKVS